MESASGAILQLSAAYTFQLSLSFINMSAGAAMEFFGAVGVHRLVQTCAIMCVGKFTGEVGK